MDVTLVRGEEISESDESTRWCVKPSRVQPPSDSEDTTLGLRKDGRVRVGALVHPPSDSDESTRICTGLRCDPARFLGRSGSGDETGDDTISGDASSAVLFRSASEDISARGSGDGMISGIGHVGSGVDSSDLGGRSGVANSCFAFGSGLGNSDRDTSGPLNSAVSPFIRPTSC